MSKEFFDREFTVDYTFVIARLASENFNAVEKFFRFV